MNNHYSIRAIPGAGKNFLSTILAKHYNIDYFIQYFDKEFNEYFSDSELVAKVDGEIKTPFWNGSCWNILPCEVRKPDEYPKRIIHEHDWIDNNDRYIRRFNANKLDRNLGIDPDNIIKNTLEGYWVSCTSKEEIDFVKKIFTIKRYFGSRPPIIFDDNNSSIDEEYNAIRSLSSVGNDNELKACINLAMDTMSFKEFMHIWIDYHNFLKEFPLNYPLSYWNSVYLFDWLKHKNFNLCDLDTYIIKFHTFLALDNSQPMLYIDNEIERNALGQLKSYDIKLNVIRYKDLFMQPKKTNTILDQHQDDMYDYHKRNVLLLKTFEDFYDNI